MSRMLSLCYVELLKRISTFIKYIIKLFRWSTWNYSAPVSIYYYVNVLSITGFSIYSLHCIMFVYVTSCVLELSITYCLYWDEVMVNMCIVSYHFHEVSSIRLLSRCASIVSLVIHMKSIIECPYLLSRTAMWETSSCYEASSYELYR